MGGENEPAEPSSRLPPYVIRPAGPRIPPDATFSYPVHAKNRSVVSQWDALCSSYSGNARRCYDHLAQTPYDRPSNPDRGKLLRGSRRLGGRQLRQYEVGGGARVWYRCGRRPSHRHHRRGVPRTPQSDGTPLTSRGGEMVAHTASAAGPGRRAGRRVAGAHRGRA